MISSFPKIALGLKSLYMRPGTPALARPGYPNEGVAEPALVKAPRIGYFGRIGDFSRFVRIFDSQDVENRLYNKKTAKIGLFRPIFVCFYAISGY